MGATRCAAGWGPAALLLPLLAAGLWPAPPADATRFVVDAGPVRRICEPVSVEVRAADEVARGWVKEVETGRTIAAQATRGADENTVRVTWIVRDLAPQEQREYDVTVGADEERVAERGGVEIDRALADGGQLAIAVGGKPFTTYHFGPDLPRPYCFPVLGPNGERVTRAYPMEKGIPGETTDHPHHRSFWFAFGAVNGVDCWTEGMASGRTVHRAFEAMEDGPVFGRLRSVNDWVGPDGQKLMGDVRELSVYDVGLPVRLVDFAITLRASEGDVTLGDTKEGMFGFRVASSMDVPRGGRIENSRGGVDESQTWGKRAEWCDHSGPVGDGISGIAMMDHPANLRHPTYWMVRGYGLFACNPFGVRAYTRDETQDGTHVIPAGEELTLRYRILIHEGNAEAADVALLYAGYASPATVRAGEADEEAAELDDAVPEGYELVFLDDFEDGAGAWLPKEGNDWEVVELEDGNHVYELKEKGEQGEIRAPGALSVIRGLTAGDFVLIAKAKCLTPASVKGRDVNAIFGFQDPVHFYYAHFSNYSNAIHNAICLVNGQPRAAITAAMPTVARLTDDEFHLLKVVRSAATGKIEAYIDDMDEPLMTAEDKTLEKGLVGIGAFDDTAVFDDVRLYVPR